MNVMYLTERNKRDLTYLRQTLSTHNNQKGFV